MKVDFYNSEHRQELKAYRTRLELGLIISLSILIILFVFSKRLSSRIDIPVYIASDNIWALDLPPASRSGGAPKAPLLPQIPIPSEDDALPEEETIELTDLDLSIGIPSIEGLWPGDSGHVGGGARGPRLIQEVVPEYPQDLIKKGVGGIILLSILINDRGIVDSVMVVDNSSGNRRLELCAVNAAKKTRYMPAGKKNKGKSLWVRRPYTFGDK
ncbi:energy transducer TonB [bacterium]|nr:energy transducer TonB [bacterium]